MLVLSRKHEQRLLIGEDIVLTIVAIRGDSVRIGIEAPRDVNIVREEICSDIRATEHPATADR